MILQPVKSAIDINHVAHPPCHRKESGITVGCGRGRWQASRPLTFSGSRAVLEYKAKALPDRRLLFVVVVVLVLGLPYSGETGMVGKIIGYLC